MTEQEPNQSIDVNAVVQQLSADFAQKYAAVCTENAMLRVALAQARQPKDDEPSPAGD